MREMNRTVSRREKEGMMPGTKTPDQADLERILKGIVNPYGRDRLSNNETINPWDVVQFFCELRDEHDIELPDDFDDRAKNLRTVSETLAYAKELTLRYAA